MVRVGTDPVAALAPLFAAERHALLESLERAVKVLAQGAESVASPELLDAMARDVHALGGVAAIETRGEVSTLVGAFERQLEQTRVDPVTPAQVDRLMATLMAMRALSAERVAQAGERSAVTAAGRASHRG